ncbi:MAG TPA: helix-turn-helix domain-containing protein, partial [Agitococcus sp.]|nr:helix-turn-helix domain-containing protein [Agitococcus sp.]
KALDDTRWNRTAAAKKLGMTFRSLRYRLKKLGLDDDSDDDNDGL